MTNREQVVNEIIQLAEDNKLNKWTLISVMALTSDKGMTPLLQSLKDGLKEKRKKSRK